MIRLAAIVLLFTSGALAQTGPMILRLGPGDLIDVEVFDVPELKQQLRVNEAGDGEFLGVGKLHVAMLTVAEAEDALATQLQQKLLVKYPQVTLIIREFGTQGVSINGEVRRPGIYPMWAPLSLLQLFAEAGGLTELAAQQVEIRHHDGNSETVATKNAISLALHPGDAVIVARTGVAYIVGEVSRAGGYAMQDEGKLSIAQLVSLGGGLRPTARASKAKLVRGTGDARHEFSINVESILRGRSPDVPLEANDILFVPDSLWKTAANRLQNITQMAAGAAIYTSLN